MIFSLQMCEFIGTVFLKMEVCSYERNVNYISIKRNFFADVERKREWKRNYYIIDTQID